jgi:hypothetical protein
MDEDACDGIGMQGAGCTDRCGALGRVVEFQSSSPKKLISHNDSRWIISARAMQERYCYVLVRLICGLFPWVNASGENYIMCPNKRTQSFESYTMVLPKNHEY